MKRVNPLDDVFDRLARSDFRSRFRLGPKERDYLAAKGFGTIRDHARGFIDRRLAPAAPPNDGRQTPWRGHPVFVAQHATATCCRTCLQRSHGVPKGRELSAGEQGGVVDLITRWIERELAAYPRSEEVLEGVPQPAPEALAQPRRRLAAP